MLVVVAILFVVVVLQPDWRTRRQVPRGVKFARGAFDKVASGVGGVGDEVAVAAVVLYKYGGVWLRREVHLARGGKLANQHNRNSRRFRGRRWRRVFEIWRSAELGAEAKI